MPLIEPIVQQVNTAIEAGLKPLGDVQMNGIADTVAREAGEGLEWIPCVIDDDGECQYVGLDDVHCVQIYHRAQSDRYQQNKKQFGDSDSRMKSMVTASMVVIADRRRIRLSALELNEFLLYYLPSSVIRIRDTATNDVILRAQIKPVTTNYNSFELFSREFKNTEYFIKPGTLFFELVYQIESEFDRSCFKTCLNCNDD